MSKTLLNVRHVHAALDTGEELLRGLDLTILAGETHVIMGPNGEGKSTLANVLMGHPDYQVTEGSIAWRGEDLTHEPTNVRARKGMFLSFQTPEEIDGITLSDFLKAAKTAVEGRPTPPSLFRKQMQEAMALLDMDPAYADRYVNVGFSGGEKKKSEILQLLMLHPSLAILDETDSGLDVDAVKTVRQGVAHYRNADNALLIISHSDRMLEELPIDAVHVLVNGVIVHSGGKELIEQINRDGYAAFVREEA